MHIVSAVSGGTHSHNDQLCVKEGRQGEPEEAEEGDESDEEDEEGSFSVPTANCNTWQGFRRWREALWAADGGDFMTNMKRRGRHKRRHVIVVPEVHLLPGDLWKGDSWCRASGLKAVWAPSYREEGWGFRQV